MWSGRKWLFEDQALAFEQVFSHDAATALIDPDTVFEDAVLPDNAGEEYRGIDGVRRASARWMEDYEWLLVELDRIIDADERVVSIQQAKMKMRHTAIEFETPLAYVWTFQGGKLVHYQGYVDVGAALKAAGLEG